MGEMQKNLGETPPSRRRSTSPKTGEDERQGCLNFVFDKIVL
jgi:hypothetical protein